MPKPLGGSLRPELPATLGAEGVGVLEAVGDDVGGLQAGDRVIFRDRDNWVQRKTVAARDVIKLPASFQGDIPQDLGLQAAMLKVNPAPAANSAVGILINRLARSNGWNVANIVRSEAAADKVRAAGGAAIAIDGSDLSEQVSAATNAGRICLGIDALAGDHCLRMADALSEGATLVTYGRLSGEPCRIEPNNLIFRGLMATGFWLGPALARRTNDEVIALYAELAEAIASGELATDIEATYPIEAIKDAAAHAKRGGRSGKVLVTPHTP